MPKLAKHYSLMNQPTIIEIFRSDTKHMDDNICTPLKSGLKRAMSSPDVSDSIQSKQHKQSFSPSVPEPKPNVMREFMVRIEGELNKVASSQSSIIHTLENIEQSLTNLTSRINNVEQTSSKHEEEIKNLQDELLATQIEVTEIKSKLDTKQSQPSIKETNHLHSILVNQAKIIDASQVKDKAYSLRQNLLFSNIQEHPQEDCIKIIDEIMYFVCGQRFAGLAIDKTHRLGPRIRGRNRPIIVRFKTHKDKEFTYSFKRELARAQIYVNIHLPDELRYKDNLISKVAKYASTKDPSAKRQGNQILYNNKKYSVTELQNSDLDLKSLHQVESNDAIGFLGRLSPLSNFYSCTIEHNGRIFNSSEQMFQQLRAEYYGDIEASAEIGLMNEPVLMKKRAKDLHTPNGQMPVENRDADREIMHKVLRAKFSSEILKGELLRTNNKQIVELNEHDTFFGVGLSLKTERFWEKSRWKGKNIMGELLMLVRKELGDELELTKVKKV